MNYKDQLNSLMRNFAIFLKDSDRKTGDSNSLYRIALEKERPSRLINTKQFIEKKDDILLYLYTVAVNLANEDYVANINTIPEFSNIEFIENSNNYVPGIKNKMILKNIRNVFDHASGIVETNEENITIINNQRMKNGSVVKFSVRQSKENLIKLLKKSIANQKQSENPIMKTLLKDIEEIENNNFENISNELSYIILMNLLLCYNKESLIDKYIKSQTSFLDLSKFDITTEQDWDKREINDEFLSIYKPVFKNDSDRKSFNKEWRGRYKFNYSADQAFIYDIDKYPVDSRTNKHIPTPIVLKHLRDANAHGWIEFKDDKVFLYDRKKKNSTPYLEISISRYNLWNFLSHDIFYESMHTYVDTFSTERDDEMFYFERAQSANDFEDYIRIYELRFPHKNKKEIIEYLLNNNKISTYILEHPDKIQSVLNYKINTKTTIMQYALLKSGLTIEDLNGEMRSFGKINKEWGKNYKYIIKKYMDAIKGKDLDFFKAYFCFLYNKDRIKDYLDYNNLNDEENKFVEQEAEKLKIKLRNSLISIPMKNPIILTEVMLTMFPRKDATVFIDAISAVNSYNKLHQRTQIKKFTVSNVERYSSLAIEQEYGILEQYNENEKRKKIAEKGLTGAGIILATQVLLTYAMNNGLDVSLVKPSIAIGGMIGLILLRNTLFYTGKNILEDYPNSKRKKLEEYKGFLIETGDPNFNKGDR